MWLGYRVHIGCVSQVDQVHQCHLRELVKMHIPRLQLPEAEAKVVVPRNLHFHKFPEVILRYTKICKSVM